MVKIPLPQTVNTGEQGQLEKRINEFFANCIHQLAKPLNARTTDFEIRVGTIATDPQQTTDDTVHRLVYQGKSVIATVTSTRTEFNRVHYDFLLNQDPFNRPDEYKKRKE